MIENVMEKLWNIVHDVGTLYRVNIKTLGKKKNKFNLVKTEQFQQLTC